MVLFCINNRGKVKSRKFHQPQLQETGLSLMNVFIQEIKMTKVNMKVCEICGKKVSSSNYKRHMNSKQCNRKYIEIPQNLLCVLCDKECKNSNSYAQHYVRCKNNPNRKLNPKSIGGKDYNKSVWNKGLTKQTDDRVAKNAKNVSKSMIELYKSGYVNPSQTDEYWTEERRKAKSEWRIQLHKDHPETHPNRRLAGNRKKMSYPESIAYDWLIRNQIEFEHNKHIDRFYVDFVIDNFIIEIDGERWHPLNNEKDIARDKILSNLGYTIHRIRSKENIENRLNEIFSDRC
jgi:very-short-patch-repair endonuclease